MSSEKGLVFALKKVTLTVEMLRWWIVGLGFVLVNMGFLYVLVELLRMPVVLATVVAAEAGTLLRFLVNDRWVFGKARPSWGRLWQYHVANAASLAIWWGATNLFAYFGAHYMIASVMAMACSVFISVLTNFFWIWRHGKPPSTQGHSPS